MTHHYKRFYKQANGTVRKGLLLLPVLESIITESKYSFSEEDDKN